MMFRRTYRIERRAHGLFFICIACGHAVNVSDFASGLLSRRTQAAAAMRAHIDHEHAAGKPGGRF